MMNEVRQDQDVQKSRRCCLTAIEAQQFKVLLMIAANSCSQNQSFGIS